MTTDYDDPQPNEWHLSEPFINVPLGLLLSALELVNLDPFPLTPAQFSMIENHLAAMDDSIKADIIRQNLSNCEGVNDASTSNS